MLDLRRKDAETILRLLSQYVPSAEVWCYGSRVTGQSHPASDIDLVLRNPSDLAAPQPALMQLKGALNESDLPILVDIVDWALIPEPFRREIEREHHVVQEASLQDSTSAGSGKAE